VRLDADQAVAVVLWVAHTHALDAADFTPYLAITSAEAQSGKTTLLDAGRTSAAALVRKLSGGRTTLLLDEVDTYGHLYEGPIRPLWNALRSTSPARSPMRAPSAPKDRRW
jgi:hypothetical protein